MRPNQQRALRFLDFLQRQQSAVALALLAGLAN